MSGHPIADAEWWTVENRITHRPLANSRAWPCLFSRREYAQEAMHRARLSWASVVHHGGNYEVIRFLEAAARLGASAIVIDPGQQGARWFSIRPRDWDWDKVRRERNLARQMEAAV